MVMLVFHGGVADTEVFAAGQSWRLFCFHTLTCGTLKSTVSDVCAM